MSVCSLVMAGAVAMPSTASADESQGSEEVLGTTAQAVHGSHMKMFQRALDEAQLRPDQKAEVDKLVSAAKDRHAPVKKAKSEFMLAVADQIEHGKIDRCSLAPKTKALAEARAKARPGDRADFEKLHSILDPEQRTRFVDSLRSQWDAAKRAHSTEAVVDKMSKELKLTDDQKEKVRDIISALKQIREAEPAYAERRARWHKILEAFKGDHFSLDEIAPMHKDAVERMTKRIEAHLWAGEAVLPVLNQEQRSTLAEKIRDKAQAHHGETEEGTEEAKEKKGSSYQEPAQEQEERKAAEQEEEEEGEEE